MQTQNGIEVDLIVERPGQPILLVEIKISTQVSDQAINSLQKLMFDLKDPCEGVFLSPEPIARAVGAIKIYPWAEGDSKLFFYLKTGKAS